MSVASDLRAHAWNMRQQANQAAVKLEELADQLEDSGGVDRYRDERQVPSWPTSAVGEGVPPGLEALRRQPARVPDYPRPATASFTPSSRPGCACVDVPLPTCGIGVHRYMAGFVRNTD